MATLIMTNQQLVGVKDLAPNVRDTVAALRMAAENDMKHMRQFCRSNPRWTLGSVDEATVSTGTGVLLLPVHDADNYDLHLAAVEVREHVGENATLSMVSGRLMLSVALPDDAARRDSARSRLLYFLALAACVLLLAVLQYPTPSYNAAVWLYNYSVAAVPCALHAVGHVLF